MVNQLRITLVIIGLFILSLHINADVIKSHTLNSASFENIKTDSTKHKTQWKRYSNVKYGFSILYPSHWKAGSQSDNGDGKILYQGNPDIDIRIYASLSEFSSPCFADTKNTKLTYHPLTLSRGKQVKLKLNVTEKNVQCYMHIQNSNITYHFWADVTKDFFKKNKKSLIATVESFTFNLYVER